MCEGLGTMARRLLVIKGKPFDYLPDGVRYSTGVYRISLFGHPVWVNGSIGFAYGLLQRKNEYGHYESKVIGEDSARKFYGILKTRIEELGLEPIESNK